MTRPTKERLEEILHKLLCGIHGAACTLEDSRDILSTFHELISEIGTLEKERKSLLAAHAVVQKQKGDAILFGLSERDQLKAQVEELKRSHNTVMVDDLVVGPHMAKQFMLDRDHWKSRHEKLKDALEVVNDLMVPIDCPVCARRESITTNALSTDAQVDVERIGR